MSRNKFIYEIFYDINYILIVITVFLIMLAVALIVPYKGKSLIVRCYCKLYIEFKIALMFIFGTISGILIVYSQNNLAFLFIFLWIGALFVLTGRYIRYISDVGIINGFFKNFIIINILLKIKDLFIKLTAIGKNQVNINKDRKVKIVGEKNQ